MRLKRSSSAWGLAFAAIFLSLDCDDGKTPPPIKANPATRSATTIPATSINQTTPTVRFLGLSTPATRAVLLIDGSGSMLSQWDTLQNRMNAFVDGLLPSQSFNIVLFREDSLESAFEIDLKHATPESKLKAYNFIKESAVHGSTDPDKAIRFAFASEPDVIYLLTNGDFPNNEKLRETIRKLNKSKMVKLNTLAFLDNEPEYQKFLKELAAENGGEFRFVKESDLQR